MSEPRLISPLLDNFIMGDAISDHNGIRCFPAMENDTGNKYIVKIVSVPASSTQLEALMLTGALKDEEAARQYVQERTDALVQEIEMLQQLSRQEGFLPYDGYQVVPMEDAIGFDIYILTEYRRSLERQFTKKPMTQLDGFNLGLDICSAMTACRRSGYLFSNLKPSNIYITESGEYQICDFGFLNLKSLKYASIPEQYIGAYTAPEITDAFSTPHETMDVFSLGMILYQVFSGGILPDRNTAVTEKPEYADDELSQIILKACAFNPEDRWQDPAQMGQMLVGYMQKYGVNDIPIVPVIEPEEISDEAEITDEAVECEEPEITEEAADILEMIDALIPEEEIPSEILADETDAEPEETPEDDCDAEASATELSEESNELPEKTPYEDVSVEVSQMLCQADMLAATEVPEPVVAPEPVEITIPEQAEEVVEEAEAISEAENSEEETIQEDSPTEDGVTEDEMALTTPQKNWLRTIVIILLFAALIVGGFLFFKFYVQKTVDNLEIIGNKDELTVKLTTQAEDSLLTVSCSDTYGKVITVPVVNDSAVFSGLAANSDYTITVNITGFHVLSGKTTGKYFTPIETVITECNVDIGTAKGSAVLKFSINGPDSKQWKFTYSTLGQQEMSVVFSGTEIILNGLKENEIYTGYLEPMDDLFIADPQPIIFTAKELIQANNLQIVSCTGGKLLAKWKAPESISVENWTVKCYNDTGFEQTVTVKNTYAEFQVPDCSDCYTVEVTAAGQKAYQKDRIEKNTVTVTAITADTSVDGVIDLKWESASTPAQGWIISYSINGSDEAITVTSNEKSIKLSPAVPSAKYTISVYSADPVETLVESVSCNTPGARELSLTVNKKEYTKKNFQFSLCTRPQTGNWTHQDSTTVYTQSFTVGQAAGFVVFLNEKAEKSQDAIQISFFISDENGYIISAEASEMTWDSMWNNGYCYLNIPSIPAKPGYYKVLVCINAQSVCENSFTVQ